MFTDTINKCAANAARIARLSANNPLGFWVSSAMAGAYVGLGIILIFTLGNLLDPSVRTSAGDGRDLWYRLNAGDYRRF